MLIADRPICVLFDIDGTLLDLHGAGRRAFALSLEDAFGWKDEIAYITFAGATDLDVLDQVFKRHKRELTPTDAARFFDVLPKRLRETSSSGEMTVFPGAADLVARLSAESAITVGLVTGNIESCAMIKLEKAGLHGFFALGAYGHEHGDRRVIAKLALARAAAGLPDGITFDRVFLIGDTPSDIDAAHAIGAKAIAVATGQHTDEMLRAAGADHVVRSLDEVTALIAAE